MLPVCRVGNSRQLVWNVFRLPTFMLFIFTCDTKITEPKRFFKYIELKESPSRFAVCWPRRANFRFQYLRTLHNPDFSLHKSTVNEFSSSEMA